MLTIDEFAGRLKSYLNPEQVNLVRRAYYYAEQAHDGQTRRSGDPYIIHPLEVASILADMHMDHQSLMAAMLHDVIEDTGIEKQDIAGQFGDVIADLVDGVSKLTHMNFENKTLAQAENFQKMALAMAKDIRVILVKLSDRLHNMRTLGVLRPDKRRRIAKETLDIYVPIANRLGMHTLRIELEDLGFFAMYPMRARLIRQAVRNARGNRKDLVSQVQQAIAARLEEEGLKGRVVGREKHLYSIYSKMKNQSKSFDDIMDMFAFRIIVDKVDSCYRALGIVHNFYKPIPGRFKDYIAIPKANGYQSLHTTLFGMHGVPIEIQIRTQEMEDMANNGIAAHWLYKSGEEALSGSHARTRQWLKGVLELQKNAGDSLEFIENVKIDLFPDEVYVFTPKGHILELPKGATAVDYAYAVHTDVGNTCVACRINKRLASLSQPLQSGQTVEVVTAPGARPNAAWLNFVVTGKARSNIRHFLKHQRRNESIALGRRLLSKALVSFDSSLEQISEQVIRQQLSVFDLDDLDGLLEDIGLGNRMAYIVAKMLVEPGSLPENKSQLDLSNSEKPLSIRGSEGMVISFGKCCYPIPGDPVVGHVSSGRGIVIHTDTCPNVSEIRHNPEKVLEVEWDKDVSGEFTVELSVELEHHRGMIASLATAITAVEGNIEKISMVEQDSRCSIVQLLLSVRDRVHLAKIIKRLRVIKGVYSIIRRRRDA
ncbi:bifunctional GTP diphosphokinase/guanosine-3',5'-bis pyrophosphate 3'-pyrophosphohydrolase [Thalassotalea sp. G20_0]|uniref:bifunctional GTP diphosphokinase/guanosine-3',5'-bis pyrophosphate 3'-pyrophosphohydrolase n=1 Tax=Thalassotalea sp. G20_0 TaxID=2821093 RepID=UPI001ADC8D09|nr:bifunctional GTP diphosphokinase/guanosine-3',5'-bis pyrophosphate 3'-pyrophosphohydrolase [Thalassotalea sp. G20_0]MBO9493594.1 bifunctional GTP diphosphokinase/guanosine-3',5'-bis pyrophosphate 3'-pyrophosphohydrolase [Thalassotalea sp. G20_0]